MPALVLGGSGFLGSHLVERLALDGQTVRVLDRAGSEVHPEVRGAQYLYADWREPNALRESLQGIDCVYHLIGTVQLQAANDDPARDVSDTVLPSIALLNACVELGVPRVVYVSSGGAVYGLPRQIPIPETHPAEPMSAHGVSKLAVEKYLSLFHTLHGLEYRVARCSNPFGEWQSPTRGQGVVAAALWQALRGEPMIIWGDGSIVRDYVYAGDVAEALLALGGSDSADGVYNVGSGEGVSLNQLASLVGEVAGRPLALDRRPARPFDVPVNVLDVSRIKAAVGWQPRTPLAEGLKRTRAWLSSLLTRAG